MDEISLVEKELKDSLKLQRLQKSKQNSQKDQDLVVQQQGMWYIKIKYLKCNIIC